MNAKNLDNKENKFYSIQKAAFLKNAQRQQALHYYMEIYKWHVKEVRFTVPSMIAESVK